MAAGLQIWDPSGRLIVDTDSSVTIILGSALIGDSNQNQSGIITHDKLSLGHPFCLVTTLEVTGFIGYIPVFTFSGNTLTWSWPFVQNGLPYPRCRFIYGLK